MATYKHSNFYKHGRRISNKKKIATTTTTLAALLTMAGGFSQLKTPAAQTVKASTSTTPVTFWRNFSGQGH